MKNNLIKLSLFIAIAYTVSSCCHGYHVALHNYSDTAKSVTVTDFWQHYGRFKKVVMIADNPGVNGFTRHRQKELPVIVDSTKHSYSFILEKGKRAWLEGGLGGPHPNCKIIIDGRDTIPMVGGDVRTVVKDNWLTYYTSYTTKIR